MNDAERKRLADDAEAWRRWGPYVSERAWGTVREDYSPDGDAWASFPHDHARSRAYRWSEDGLGGICDDRQTLCLAFAFWNGRDPILKERIFGLTGEEGNHGEDAKEYWWYLDSTPTHSWMRWRYVYPQGAFPYRDLLDENRRRGRRDPEYELLDTGAFAEGRYWDVEVQYAKAAPDDLCLRVRVRNAGPEPATLHLLPTLWFRNRWAWNPEVTRPTITHDGGTLSAQDPAIGRMTLAGSGDPQPLFCDNDTNARREIAIVLAEQDPAYEDVAVKFFEHFTMISEAINDRGLWDEEDGFYYDNVRRAADGAVWPVKVRSMTGLIPLCAVAIGDAAVTSGLPEFQERIADLLAARPEYAPAVEPGADGERPTMLALVGRDRLPRVLERLADEGEFLSPHGLRALSATYRDRPFTFTPAGGAGGVVDYEPAESTTTLFGGNSNWRGPVWFPVNHLVMGALQRFQRGLGDGFTIEFPRGSGRQRTLEQVTLDLAARLVGIFLPDASAGRRRPVFGGPSQFQDDPAWHDALLFHEYFHGDNGAGLGASHQTGWTGLVADLIVRLSRAREGSGS